MIILWENAEKVYDYVAEKGIYVEDLDIQLHTYVFPMTSELLTFCKDNSYRIDISEGTIMSYPHYDFTYTDIDSVEWVTNCTEETKFSVGTCAAAGFNFSIFSEKYLDDGSVVTYDKIEFKAAVVIPVYDFSYEGGPIVQKQLGVFHVDDYENEAGMIDFTCLDNMHFFDKRAKGIHKYISVPLKSNALIGKIIQLLNLAEGTFPAAVKHFQINKVEHLKKLTYRTILSYAMEALGCYAYANSVGEICSKCFYASADPVATIAYDDVMEEKSKGTGVKINGYEIQYGDIAISAFSYAAGEEIVEVPIPLTVDNPLFINKKQESLDTIGKRLFDRMYGFTFDPHEVTTFLPNFYIEAGDFVNVENKYGELHKVLVSQLTWRDNLEMEIVSACETGDADGDYDSNVNEAIQRNENIDSIPSDEDEEEGIIETSFTGIEFNSAVKTVYNGNETSYETYVDGIQTISFSEEPPGDDDVSVTLEYNNNGYEFLVYAPSGDKSNIKMYTSADVVKLAGDMQCMFKGLNGLKTLDLSKFDTSKVKDMRYMFYGCCDLVSLDLSKFDTSEVKNMLGMLGFCESLKTLDLSNFDTSNVISTHEMFKGCSELTLIDLSGASGENIQSTRSMFLNCSKLASIVLSNFETSASFLSDVSYMFAGCPKLTSIDLSKVNTNASTDMEHMFYSCSAMKEILVGSGWVEGKNTANMFSGCGCSSVTYAT